MERKHFITVALVILILLSGFTYQMYSQSLPSRIDELVSDYVVNQQFMGSVLVAEKGKVVFAKGYGLADVEKNIPNTPDTKFMIGSITKQFTAMLITQLVEKGKLKLYNTISDFIPEFPRDIGDKITVEMLLCHSSGLILPEGIEKYYYATSKEEWLQEYLKQLSEEGLRFEPGKSYGYSNGGYFILGLIIEKVTGKNYEEVLTEQILKPLGMTQTGCDRKGSVLENRAISYRKLPDRYITWNEEINSYDPAVWGFGCGNLYSTVVDLFKFSKALSTNQLLSKKYKGMYLEMRSRLPHHMMTPYMSKELVNEFYGTFGNGFVGEISIINDPVTNEKEILYWHDGTNKLFMSQHYHYSGKEQIIIICGNSCFRLQGDEIALKIHQLINNKPYDHSLIKHSLTQYIEEDVAMHAGISAAIGEYRRFKNDTLHFIVPGKEYFINISYQVAEMGNLDWAVEILQAAITEFPEYWEAYDALGETYIKKGDKEQAIQCFKKSVELNPQNTKAIEMLKKLEKK